MRFAYKFILTALVIPIMSACTPSKYDIALTNYQNAIEEKNLTLLLPALTILSQLAPEEYSAELKQIINANKQYLQAVNYLEHANPYLAYITVHDSYQKFPSVQSKDVLLKSGKVMLPLLRVNSALKQSIKQLPSKLQEMVLSYDETPVTEWNLIDVNQLLEKINQSLFALTNANTILKRNGISNYSTELSLWSASIQAQKQQLLLIKNHIIHSSLNQSALQLQLHNQILVDNSEELLSLVHEKLALQSLQSLFIKTQQQYQPYREANQNISLASSAGNSNKNATWYSRWRQLEDDTLTLPTSVDDYIMTAKQRANEINDYINQKKITVDVSSKLLAPLSINILIKKLKKDKTMLLYGATRSNK